MDKKVILVDLDDTIEDLQGEWFATLNMTHNLNVSKEDITTWDIKKAFPTLSYEQIYAPFYSEKFWENIKPYPDAQEYLNKLVMDGYEIYICTATHVDFIKVKFNAIIQKFFPFIDYKHLIVTYNKKIIKCDYIIDDYHENLIGALGKGIMLDKSYNRCCVDESIKRVYNWKEIYDFIRGEL